MMCFGDREYQMLSTVLSVHDLKRIEMAVLKSSTLEALEQIYSTRKRISEIISFLLREYLNLHDGIMYHLPTTTTITQDLKSRLISDYGT